MVIESQKLCFCDLFSFLCILLLELLIFCYLKSWDVPPRILICTVKSNTSRTVIAIAVPPAVVVLVLSFICLFKSEEAKENF